MDQEAAPEKPESPELSVIVPVSERFDDVRALYREYRQGLEPLGRRLEFIYVIDGEYPDVVAVLRELQAEGEPITIIKLAKWFGEATALTAGFEAAAGEILLTLPAYHQVVAEDLPKLVAALDRCDMAIGRRSPRIDAGINRLQSRLFHVLLNLLAGSAFHDLGCGARALRRQVVAEVPIYGDQHRFFPLLASRSGFRIQEVDLRQSPLDPHRRVYRPGVYLRRLLDILTVFFLVKFTKKPLRFFGLLGSATFGVGALLVAFIVFERLFLGVALAERPALLLSSLLVVLGAQLFALGLLGELIIFTHAKHIKEYTIAEIINRDA